MGNKKNALRKHIGVKNPKACALKVNKRKCNPRYNGPPKSQLKLYQAMDVKIDINEEPIVLNAVVKDEPDENEIEPEIKTEVMDVDIGSEDDDAWSTAIADSFEPTPSSSKLPVTESPIALVDIIKCETSGSHYFTLPNLPSMSPGSNIENTSGMNFAIKAEVVDSIFDTENDSATEDEGGEAPIDEIKTETIMDVVEEKLVVDAVAIDPDSEDESSGLPTIYAQDTVAALIAKPFSQRPAREKKTLAKGRPVPDLTGIIGAAFKNNEGKTIYNIYSWLCGSVSNRALYCWPCLLISKKNLPLIDLTDLASATSFNELTAILSSHRSQQSHIECEIKLQRICFTPGNLGPMNVRQEQEHNDSVRLNHQMLKVFINAFCFSSHQDLVYDALKEEPLRAMNCEFFKELVHFLCGDKPLLIASIDSSPVFGKITDNLLADLAEAVSIAIINAIERELKMASFVSVMLEESTDVYPNRKVALMLRYCLNGTIYERFVKFIDIDEKSPSLGIINQIKTLGIEKKIVSFSYDAKATSCQDLSELVNSIKALFGEHILFVPSYSMILSSTLLESLRWVPKVRIFFAELYGLVQLLKRPCIQDILKQKRRPIEFDEKENEIPTIHSNMRFLRLLFDELDADPKGVDTETLTSFPYILDIIEENVKFNVLLIIFNNLIDCMKPLINMLAKNPLEFNIQSDTQVSEVKHNLSEMKSKWPLKQLILEVLKYMELPNNATNRDVLSETEYDNIISSVDDMLTIRFKDYNTVMHTFAVFSPHSFQRDAQQDNKILTLILNTYSSFFDQSALVNQLRVLFAMQERSTLCPYKLYRKLSSENFGQALSEVHKFSEFVSTLPVAVPEGDIFVSSMKYLKLYCEGRWSEERINRLALPCIEYDLLKNLNFDVPQFFEDVVRNFSSNRRDVPFHLSSPLAKV